MKIIFTSRLTKNRAFFAASLLGLFFTTYALAAESLTPEAGYPVRYLSSCETDLNADGVEDVALLMDTQRGRELVVLLAQKGKKPSYQTHVLYTGKDNYQLRCRIGASLKSVHSKGKTPAVVTTPGVYLELKIPESASVAYYWQKDAFQQTTTED